jgi:hypothetical protein
MGTVEYQDRYRIIWIYEEQVYGTILSEGAHASLVRYSKDGIDYKVYLENDEFSVMDEIGFMHIEEDDEDNLL